MKKRLLSVLLCLCMALGMLPAITMTVQAAGTGVADRLNQLRNDYPDKQYWYRVNGVNKVTTTPCPHRDYRTDCGSYNGGWQCWAFASKIFCDIFKQNPDVFGDQRKDKENIRVGDYVRFSWPSNKTYGHSFVVLSISGSIVTAVECNTEEGNCRIRWDRGKYDLNSGMLAYDPYGKLTNYYFDYYCRATNYDEVNISSSVNLGNDFYAYINYDTTNYRLENHSNGNVQLAFKNNSDPRQLWHFTWQGSSYKISSVYNTNCLDAAGAGNAEGTNVHAYLDNGNIQQRWIISKDIDNKSNTYNLLTAYNSNLAVDVVASVAQNGQDVTLWSRNHNQAQKFQIQKLSTSSLGSAISYNMGSDFYARISYNGAYLQTTGSTTTVSSGRGMDVRLTRTSSITDKRQIWHFIRQSNGSYKIVNEYSGWCLDVESGVTGNGKNIWTWYDDHGDSPERWYLVYSPGDSSYRIVSAISYPGALYSLDIPGGGANENANVELYEQNSNVWQYFNITKLSSYPPQTHVHSYTSRVISPTCTTGGYTTYTCSRCGDSYVDDYTNALNHNYNVKETTATCTEQGFTTHTCSRCGDSYIDNYTDALGHSYGEWTVTRPATSTETGQRERTCSRCGNKETETVPTIADTGCEHNYRSVVTAPTCFKQGYITHTCGKCSDSYVDSYIDALGHQYSEHVTAPACTNQGYTTYICSRCDHSYVDTYTAALGHNYGEWTTTVPATATTNGQKERSCSRCGEKQTSVIPATGGTSSNTPSHGSGDSNVPTYRIDVPTKITGGTVKISSTNASAGQRVIITVNPAPNYSLEKLTVTDSKNTELMLMDEDGGKYSFTMSKSKVSVIAVFQPAEKPWNNPFQDITADMWYYDAVRFVNENSLMNGIGNDLFAPNSSLSRAQLAQILYNREGRPAAENAPFADVSNEAWYNNAVAWAAEKGMVSGYGDGLFGPGDSITREQLAVILWRYAGSPTAASKELCYNDADAASGYALESLCWATENGIISGYSNGQLAPKGEATRAQVAQMLKKFIEG